MDDRTTVSSKKPPVTKAAAEPRRASEGWVSTPADERGDEIVAAMGMGGVDYMFFNSGSEIMFMQEAIAKANAQGRPAPKLIMMAHEYVALNAAWAMRPPAAGWRRRRFMWTSVRNTTAARFIPRVIRDCRC